MYVRVKYRNNIYYSYVFAYFGFDYMPHYVVYNNIEDKFEIVAYLSKKSGGHRQIGFMNENEKDFVYEKELNLNMGKVNKCRGYEWLIKNVDLLRDIENDKLVKEEYKTIAKEMNDSIDPDAWNEVETEEDAIDMMNHVGGFHDWYLVGFEGNSNYIDCNIESKFQLRFTSQAAFDVLVEFEGGIYVKYGFCTCNRIYLSSVVIDGDHKYWVDGEEDCSVNDIKYFDYIHGNKLRWKFILKEEDDW